jgi:hypothetical protein
VSRVSGVEPHRDNAPAMKRLSASLCAVLWIGACSPAADWRQLRPPGLGVSVSFPCRPASHEREVQLATRRLKMVLYACKADGASFALASTDVGDVRLVTQALSELGESAARNVAATSQTGEPARIPGMTPNVQARRFELAGRLPSGNATVEHVAVFARGTRIYQATVIGSRPAPTDVQVFFDAIRLEQ